MESKKSEGALYRPKTRNRKISRDFFFFFYLGSFYGMTKVVNFKYMIRLSVTVESCIVHETVHLF